MATLIHHYPDQTEALRALTEYLRQHLATKSEEHLFNLALSGGNTAQLMFRVWTEEYATSIPWKRIRFFWVDERCVPPSDPESNYGNANQQLFSPLHIPDEHVFRIHAEQSAKHEVIRYSNLLLDLLPSDNNMPLFDCIILGIGTDGHTASLFPSYPYLLTSTHPYAISIHPKTGQNRITMTGTCILNKAPLLIPVFGAEKEDILRKLLALPKTIQPILPAGYILSHAQQARIFIA